MKIVENGWKLSKMGSPVVSCGILSSEITFEKVYLGSARPS